MSFPFSVASPSFFEALKNSKCKVSNGKHIEDLGMCKLAAEKLGKKFIKEDIDLTSQPGCFAHESDNSEVYYKRGVVWGQLSSVRIPGPKLCIDSKFSF